MHRKVLRIGSLLCAIGVILLAQTAIAPKPPFTAAQAEHGKQIAAKSLEIRAKGRLGRSLSFNMRIQSHAGDRFLKRERRGGGAHRPKPKEM
jgi:hypothetical protein